MLFRLSIYNKTNELSNDRLSKGNACDQQALPTVVICTILLQVALTQIEVGGFSDKMLVLIKHQLSNESEEN